MSEQVYIRLGSTASDQVHWLVWSSSEQEIIASGELNGAVELEQIRSHTQSRKTMVFVPGRDVSLREIELPARSGRKILSAVPFMMEDDLANDVENLFFAFGDKQGQLQQVAVVHKDKMNFWRKNLTDAGIVADSIQPDVLALPLEQDSWSVVRFNQDVLVRQGEWKGFVAEQDWVNQALTLDVQSHEEAQKITNYSEHSLAEVPHCDVQQGDLELPLLTLAKSYNQKFNLLQGTYRKKKESNQHWKTWRMAAILAGVSFLAHVGTQSVELYQLNERKTLLDQQIKDNYRATFPNEKRIVNVRSQLRRHLASMGASGDGVTALALLNQLEPAFAQTDVRPENVRFEAKRGEIRLQAVAKSFDGFEQFKKIAESSGLTVQQGAISNQEDGVSGTLSIRSQS